MATFGRALYWFTTLISALLCVFGVILLFGSDQFLAIFGFGPAIIIYSVGWGIRSVLAEKEPSRYDKLKSELQLQGQQQRRPVLHWLTTTACRLFVTFMMAIAGVFWVEDVHSFLILLSVALLIDTVRNFKAPELALIISQIEDDLGSAHPDLLAELDEKCKKQSYQGWLLFLPFAATSIVLLVNETESGMAMIATFAESSFLQHLLPFFKFIERHAIQVRELGHEDRVALVYAVYIANLIAVGISVAPILSGPIYLFSIAPLLKAKNQERSIKSSIKYSKYLINPGKFFRFTILFYILCVWAMQYIYPGYLIAGYMRYNIDISSFYFFIFSLLLTGAAVFFGLTLTAVIRMRFDASGLWLKLIYFDLFETVGSENNNDNTDV